MMVMRLAPIGVFCLIAKTFAGLGFSAMVPMFKYMGAVLLALFIQCCGVYQVLLALFTRLNPLRFLKKFAPVMGFAFSTATSNATIPMNIDTLEEKIGVNRRISSFTIPLGATINMDGTSIMQGVAVVFVAQAFGRFKAELAACAEQHDAAGLCRKSLRQGGGVGRNGAGNGAVGGLLLRAEVEQGIAARREGVKRFRCQFHGLLLQS